VPDADGCWCADSGVTCWALRESACELSTSPTGASLAEQGQRLQREAAIWRLGLVPWERALGCKCLVLTPPEAEALGLHAAHGFQIAEIEASGPAAAAGLNLGDCVLRVNGRSVSAAGVPFAAVRAGSASLDVWYPGHGRRNVRLNIPKERLAPAEQEPTDASELMRRALREVMGEESVVPLTPPVGGGR
jgi:hypothetical protein